MTYVMSDLHGCYDKYVQMLEKIGFGDGDTLYILGDVIDRGPDGIRILLDMMGRKNVVPLLGNHELLAFRVFRSVLFGGECKRTATYRLWMESDGAPTLSAFLALDTGEREAVTVFLESFDFRKRLGYDDSTFFSGQADKSGGKFHLSHTLPEYDPLVPLHEADCLEFCRGEPDYDIVYADEWFVIHGHSPDIFFVTGHTPTHLIDPAFFGKIWQGNNHIAIDCAAAWGGRLGCLCLDTMEEYYV